MKKILSFMLVISLLSMISVGSVNAMEMDISGTKITDKCFRHYDGNGVVDIKVKVGPKDKTFLGGLFVHSGDIVRANNVEVFSIFDDTVTYIRFQRNGFVTLQGDVDFETRTLGHKYIIKSKGDFHFQGFGRNCFLN